MQTDEDYIRLINKIKSRKKKTRFQTLHLFCEHRSKRSTILQANRVDHVDSNEKPHVEVNKEPHVENDTGLLEGNDNFLNHDVGLIDNKFLVIHWMMLMSMKMKMKSLMQMEKRWFR